MTVRTPVKTALIARAKLPTRWGEFIVWGFVEEDIEREHVALVMGDIPPGAPILTRVHSECLTGDALFSLRCDCGPQLQAALRRIGTSGRGVLVYLRQEGRGIGLMNKIRAYDLQDAGADTVEANEALGFLPDHRDYAVAADILRHIGVTRVRLLTNNPEKLRSLSESGIEVVERLPLKAGGNPHNRGYLKTKAAKFGHMLDDD